MAEPYMIESDINFIKEIGILGGEDLKNVISVPHAPWHAPSHRITILFPEKR
jgi:hypothetical protein